MGRTSKTAAINCQDPASFAEQLNNFFSRFDKGSTPASWNPPSPSLSHQTIIIDEKLVASILRQVNPYKAPGPDRLRGRVLKDCSTQLSGVFTKLFQGLLDSSCVPYQWKESTIIPIPKKTHAKDPKDFRPVALTSLLCKCMERVVGSHLSGAVTGRLDPLQFAYKAKRGVEDATLTLLDTVTRQLDSLHTHTRILFMDFSSAFNMVHTHTLLQHLVELQVHPILILWIKNFLQDRPQQVRVNGFNSRKQLLNTGLPQGCVLSPALFSVYTNNISCNKPGMILLKYADDMALVAHLSDTKALSDYHQTVNNLVTTFQNIYLDLNIAKTKELCCQSRETKNTQDMFEPLSINGQPVEQVNVFKYLGTEIDTSMSFSQHADSVYKKAQQRLHLLRKLRDFNVSKDILTRVYQSLIESLLTFNISGWYNALTVKHKSKLARIINQASKIIGSPQTPLTELHTRSVLRIATVITQDPTHPLNQSFQLLPSGRRYRVPLARKNVYKKSFVPTAIVTLNSHL